MREISVKENVNKVKELQNKYPNTLKFLSSEGDVDSIDMDIMMKGENQAFDNADSDMPEFLADQLALGKEVAILPAGKSKVMVFADYGLFKS